MVKKIQIKIPDEVYKRLEEKFPEKEDLEAKIRKIAIEIIEAPSGETWHYRQIKGLVKDLANAGKEITSENLSKYATENGELCGVSMARDWLKRMEGDKYIKLIRRDRGGKKIYHWEDKKVDSETR